MAELEKYANKDTLYSVIVGIRSKHALKEHTHTRNDITDFPSSMPASDVYSWAKSSSKPTYTASEVGAVPTTTGFGQQLSNVTSSNNNTISGTQVRYSSSGATSKPTGTDHALFQMAYNDNWKTQLAMDWRTNKMYMRVCTNGTWSNWREMAGTDNITNITIDSTLNNTSTNPVQNKAIYNALANYAKKSDVASVYKFAGVRSAANLDPSKVDIGNVYNMTTSFTTDNNFMEGSGKTYPAGTNIVCVLDGEDNSTKRWDVLGSSYDLSNYVTNNDVDIAATASKIVQRDGSGHINCNYLKSAWLYTSAATDRALSSCKGVAVLGTDGYIYYRSKDNIKADLGIKNITLTENSDGTVDISIT